MKKSSGAGERWRLLTTWNGAPGFNMALDEALLELGGARPTLRFYTWSPDTLSLGYFQRYADVVGIERAGAVVRRRTGGGAIHHLGELTFSIACDADHPLYRGPVANSYERVHGLIARALTAYGVEAHLRGSEPLRSDRVGTGMCFHHSTAQDLVWSGAKGVGSAQRRRQSESGVARVLHHGSIKLATTELETNIATLANCGDPTELAEQLRTTFGSELGIEFTPTAPTEAERAWAAEQAGSYTAEEFLRRR